MPTIISHPFTIFASLEAAQKVVDGNMAHAEDGDDTEFRITPRDDGRFTIAMFEAGEFVMCL